VDGDKTEEERNTRNLKPSMYKRLNLPSCNIISGIWLHAPIGGRALVSPGDCDVVADSDHTDISLARECSMQDLNQPAFQNWTASDCGIARDPMGLITCTHVTTLKNVTHSEMYKGKSP
jgi:hypothetical protein